VGPTTILDVLEKREISCPYRDSNPDSLARRLVTILTTLTRLYMIIWAGYLCILE